MILLNRSLHGLAEKNQREAVFLYFMEEGDWTDLDPKFTVIGARPLLCSTIWGSALKPPVKPLATASRDLANGAS